MKSIYSPFRSKTQITGDYGFLEEEEKNK